MATQQLFVNYLIELLKTGDEAERFYSARSLGKSGEPQAVSALTGALLDDDEDVVMEAAHALAQLPDQSTVEALKYLTSEHPDGDVRTAATETLGELAKTVPSARSALYPLVEPDNQEEAWYDGWDDRWDIQRAAVIALGNCKDRDAVPVLRSALDHDDCQDIEPEIMKALAQCGDRGEQVLVDYLSADLSTLSALKHACRAARALRHGSEKSSAVALFKATSYVDDELKLAAIESIAFRNCHEYLIDMMQLLVHESAEVRLAAMKAAEQLSRLPQADCRFSLGVEKLVALLSDSLPEVQTGALQILSRTPPHKLKTHQTSIAEQLAECLLSANSSVVSATLDIADLMPASLLKTTLSLQLENHEQPLLNLKLLTSYWPDLVSSEEDLAVLTTLIEHDQPVIRQTTLDSLAKLAKSENEVGQLAFAQFEHLLLPEQSGTDSTAADDNLIPLTELNSVGDAIDKDEFRESITAINEDYPEQQTRSGTSTLEAITLDNIAVSTGLHSRQEVEHREFLEGMMAELPEEMEEFADIARGNMEQGEKVLDQGPKRKRKIARLPDTDVNIQAIRALSLCSTPKAVNLLLIALANLEDSNKHEAIACLTRIASHQVSDLQNDFNNDLDNELANAFGPAATSLLAGNETLRLHSARLLAAVGNPAALPVLMEALEDQDINVQIAAIEALSHISKLSGDLSEDDHGNPLPSITDVLLAIHQKLSANDSGPRLAAIKALAEHKVEDVVDDILTAGLIDYGSLSQQAITHTLEIDSGLAGKALLNRLKATETSTERNKLIAMTELQWKASI
ncbi:hypothetical protein EOPP23_03425 [Endozoicomonas sp. OPT23]|uniref:HEAT repeat domain-containing protein n=1 Tax=Endozoicomonas sp. OPT23 TaxID=2072845 RepID=UPI00129A19E7|nr:HEAT repeat domain-containing protein [Endozoicomonas sp. OPT23]MRI32050.1 hypothetical protein [Endozoicomonas sp. OPT23]